MSVKIHVKSDEECVFIYETSNDRKISSVITDATAIFNGRLKVERICNEMEELAKHGIMFLPDILTLSEEEVNEFRLDDDIDIERNFNPKGGFQFCKDPLHRRNGKQPSEPMQLVLRNAVAAARQMISQELVSKQQTINLLTIQQAIVLLKDAVLTVYPKYLPTYDIIRVEFENAEYMSGNLRYVGCMFI